MKVVENVTGFCGHCNKAIGEFMTRSNYQKGPAQFHHTGKVVCPDCRKETRFIPVPGYVFVPLQQPGGGRRK